MSQHSVSVYQILLVIPWRRPSGIMAKVLNCGLKESKFKLQSCYSLAKGMNSLILPLMLFFYKNGFDIK